MSPASEATPLPRVFLQRLVHEVPSLQDALSLYNTTKKERQYVGAALQVAEAGVSVVANTALPLAHPLLSHWGGWGTLDAWACQGLDCVEEAAPIITQPTTEHHCWTGNCNGSIQSLLIAQKSRVVSTAQPGQVVSQTRALVLQTIAGQGEDLPPNTLSDAVTARAMNTARVVAGTQAGMAVAGAAHRLLNTANAIVDTLLPVEKLELVVVDHDKCGGTFGVQVVVLKEKCHKRMKAKISDVLQVTHDDPLNPDDLHITVGLLLDYVCHLHYSNHRCSTTPVPVLLMGLECSLEVLFFKHVKHYLRFTIDLLHGVD
ncbi:hypothetical protein GWK47_024192 [Chionoecetes opilio]|uniref:Uncharacterized protein n=1 Tax=Chionoecetes opilio TaxID=41210 RepID=A0A8J4XPY7_CHIOP|nr:hypothetical protein GWK47_024192 [Chionoecetes opilio]